MYIKDLQQCLNKGIISQREYDEIFKKMSISPDGNQLIGGIPKTKGVIKYYLEGDMSDDSLLEFLTTRITVPYGAEDIDPLFRTYGVMVCGICDYWSWFTKDNITPHAISCGHKPIEYASDKELWKMIAICSRYHEVFYEREYDRVREKQIPKKVTFGYDEQDSICCPNCKVELMSMDWYDHWKCNYCEGCGQALDWSDSE